MNGVYNQYSGAVLELRGDNTGTSDQFTADTMNLAGTLRVRVQPGLYTVPQIYSNVVALTGGGAITTTFDRFTATSPFFTVTPTYNTGDAASYQWIDLTLARIPFGSVPGLTANQQAVGNALENAYATTPTGNAETFYRYLFAATSISVLDLLSGEGSTAAQSAAINSGSLFNNAMLNQALFGDNNGAASLVYNPTPLAYAPAAKRGHEAFAAIKPQQQVGFVPPGRWRVWTSGFGSKSSINGETLTGSASQSLRSYGGTLGLDYQLQADLLIGIAVGASESNFSVSDRATDGRLTGGHIGLYGIKTWGPYYLAATASYANFDNTINRTITGIGTTENTTGRFTSDQLGGRLELGWKQIYARHTITPFVAVEPAVLWQRGYTETSTTVNGTPGILGLTYAAKTTTSLPTFVGVQFDTRYTFANGMLLTPYGRVSWVHEFNPNRQISASFITVPGANFTVDGARAARDAARLDAGARLALAPRASLFANVSGEFSDRARSYTAMGGFRGFW